EQTGDRRLIPALTLAADWLWANAWSDTNRSMWYEAAQPTAWAPDLNLLIAPMYAFLYRQTGDTRYRDQGDAIFSGGVDLAWLDGAKQFNQNYWWSFEYLTWRSALRPSDTTTVPSDTASVTSTPTPAMSGSTTSSSNTLPATSWASPRWQSQMTTYAQKHCTTLAAIRDDLPI